MLTSNAILWLLVVTRLPRIDEEPIVRMMDLRLPHVATELVGELPHEGARVQELVFLSVVFFLTNRETSDWRRECSTPAPSPRLQGARKAKQFYTRDLVFE